MSSAGVRLAVVAAAVLVSGLVIGIAVIGGLVSNSASTAGLASLELSSESCAISGPVTGLSAEQSANANVIVSTAFADSGESPLAARIALMVADAESGLVNLGVQPGNDGSLGLFQQRVSQGWGTASEEMDPAQATAMFVRRLLAVPGWTSRPPWQVAEQVQRSAFTNGDNYKKYWAPSAQLLAMIESNADAAGGCGQGVPDGLAGTPSAHGVPAGYTIPAGTPPAHSLAVSFALAQLGKAYVWGAAGPNTFDCSGLTMAAWATAGLHLDHYTVDQLSEGQPASPATMVAGDLILIPGSDAPGPGLPGHVGIYLGNGLVLSAVDPQMGVAVQTWQVFVSGGLDGVIDPAPGR